MGSITTGIISFSLILINIGYDENFFSNWFKSWAYAYLFVIPAILFIAPPVEKFVEFIITKAS
ncbi:DUF2798 domain-containing protein [Tenacibaculum litopenaei]|uniref:DUF2798 domain-containing protein n=1 Tax=Tenacibaculum litopenaei TaxID=396016 RepID=UPI0038B43029